MANLHRQVFYTHNPVIGKNWKVANAALCHGAYEINNDDLFQKRDRTC